MRRVLVALSALCVLTLRCAAAEPAAPVDVDQLAGRMTKNGEIYRQVRDEALAAYAKLHATPADYDKDAQHAIRLAAYLWVWGDFYGEGLWKAAILDAGRVKRAGGKDPLVEALPLFRQFEHRQSTSDVDAQAIDFGAGQFAATGYPAAFKFWYDRIDARNLADGTHDQHFTDPKTTALVPGAVAKAVKAYGDLVKAHDNDGFLFDEGHLLLSDIHHDGDAIEAAGPAMDEILAKAQPDGALRAGIAGSYNTNFAWSARGAGYAETVTAGMQDLFSQRLGAASNVLEPAYTKHPGAGYLARQMITVELGQGQGRDRMELWFDRAMKADPDDIEACRIKANYLTAKWYGSDDDHWNFIAECAKSQKWAGKIPLLFEESLQGDLGPNRDAYLSDPDKWAVMEAAFRGYLAQFPGSTYHRSVFARYAVEGRHWAVAEEQFKILGENWDETVFPGERYPQMRKLADTNSASPAPKPSGP